MSDIKNVFKGGWHPKGKDGGKESWRGDFKGINQVAGWVGKGKQPGSGAENTHISRPLASLKDPSQFGPPPKNVNYHGGAALPNEITPHTGGLGAPLSHEQIVSARSATATPTQEEVEQSQKPAPPPLPYRADRTGLKTDTLPPPPTHKNLRDVSPAPVQQASRAAPVPPPRLPSRQNSYMSPPPPTYESATTSAPVKSSTPTLNQSAINRLGNAGVSVPGFGIGKSSSNATPPAQTNNAGLSELQSRFSKMNTSFAKNNASNTATSQAVTTPTSPQPEAQPQAPSWQQTRHALTTANSAYKDPSSVSLADAQNAAQTAQNAQKSATAFRDRHSETINAAQTRATQLNKRYNMTGRLNKFLEDANTAHDQQVQATQQQPGQVQGVAQNQVQYQQPMQSPPIQQQPAHQWPTQHHQPVASPPPQSATPELVASITRKPPPPPPPKKPASMQAPPPIPLGTKPNFG